MDSEKLLRILKDLEQDEKSLGIDGKIEAIRTDLAQNTPEASGCHNTGYDHEIAKNLSTSTRAQKAPV